MGYDFLDIASTPSVRAAQEAMGSAGAFVFSDRPPAAFTAHEAASRRI